MRVGFLCTSLVGGVAGFALYTAFRKERSRSFSFGVIADVQYVKCARYSADSFVSSEFSFSIAGTDLLEEQADHEDGTNFEKTRTRRFRQTPLILEKAVAAWNCEQIEFIAQLGDLIDGKSKAAGQSVQDLHKILRILSGSSCQHIHHLIGNHDLYNFDRADPNLAALLRKSSNGTHYYSFAPTKGWKFIVLDPYDISTSGPAQGTVDDAWTLLESRNPNNVRDDDGDWYRGLAPSMKQWVPPNGALGPQQLEWLRAELSAADSSGDKAVLLTHVPLLPTYDGNPALLWNWDEVQKVCDGCSSLVLVLSGHDHDGGYVVDRAGVHHVTLPSPLNCPLGGEAFATVDMGHHSATIRGRGDMPVMDLPYRVPRESMLRCGSIKDLPNPFTPEMGLM